MSVAQKLKYADQDLRLGSQETELLGKEIQGFDSSAAARMTKVQRAPQFFIDFS